MEYYEFDDDIEFDDDEVKKAEKVAKKDMRKEKSITLNDDKDSREHS